ncbi:MAG: cache domain-containing protein [Neomegalonema sp.]|nr:cache domain-containing protein [Neomegalonema sp.]
MTLRLKVLLLSIIPLIVSALLTGLVIWHQANKLTETQLAAIEHNLLQARKQELVQYMDLVTTALSPMYRHTDSRDLVSQTRARHLLDRMRYGNDGYFFAYDYNGTNMVHPKQAFRVGQNWLDYQDPAGTRVINDLIEVAKTGGGFVSYLWEKPSTGEISEKISYAIGLPKWQWMIGTGLYVDDITTEMQTIKGQVGDGIRDAFVLIGGVTLAAVAIVFVAGLLIQMHEQKIADTQLRALTGRIIAAQEEERARVARELHDGVSQILVSARFALERALLTSDREAAEGNSSAPDGAKVGEMAGATAGAKASAQDALDRLGLAMQEIRRVSRDLRPSVLDDLGLVAALEGLLDDFETRTGIEVAWDADVPALAANANAVSQDAKTALYRVAQEALTNIERHARADLVTVKLDQNRAQLRLTVSDDGVGLPSEEGKSPRHGLGLRNMHERMEQIGGQMQIISRRGLGTKLKASAPMSLATSWKSRENMHA